MFTVVVNTLADVVDSTDQYMSLREAVAHSTDHSVSFDPSLNGGRILLTAGPLSISKSITITGPGADKLAIDAAGASRVMSFGPGYNVTLSGFSITGGNSSGGGGGIYNSANLTLVGVDVSGNVTDTSGGGIYVAEGGKLGLYSSTVHGNRSGSTGGGIGGVLNAANALQIVGSTVSNNTSLSGGGVGVSGPVSGSGSFLISRATITENLASNGVAGGGGGVSYSGSLTATSHGSIIAGNRAFVGDTDDVNGVFVTGSTHNVIGRPGASGFVHNTYGNRVGTNVAALDPKLSPLDFNGGPTRTHVPLPGSPALDAGGPETQYTPLIDQRGFKRLSERPEANVASAEDIGAVELSSTVGTSGDFNGDNRPDQLLFDPTTNSLGIASGAATSGRYDVEHWNVMPSEVTALSTFVVGDVNGDGRDDLLIRSGNVFRLGVSDGSTFITRVVVLPTNWTHIYTGDFDGDGSDEILGGFNGGSGFTWTAYNYLDGVGLLPPTTVAITGFSPGGELYIQDANGDGFDDLITRVNSSAPWMVNVASLAGDGSQLFQVAADWSTWIGAGFSGGVLDADKAIKAVIEQFASVYNNVELELYPGLMKGPTATQQTKAGNNWDQAALLESKLQSLPYFGVNDVKIASGKVRASIGQFREWLGLKPTVAPTQVLSIIRAALDNGAGAVDGAGVIITTGIDANATAIEFTHAWVQARVPTAAGLAWVYLDPSWKFKDRQTGMPMPAYLNNTHTSRGLFDEFSYIRQPWTQYLLPVEFYEDELMKWIGENPTYFGSTLSEVAYDGPIKPKYLNSLPPGLSDGMSVAPGATTATYESYDAIVANATWRDELTHRVTVQMKKGTTAQWAAPVQLTVPSVSLNTINITFANSAANIPNPDSIATAGPNYFGRLVVNGSVVSSAVAGQSFGTSDIVSIEVKHLAPTKLTALTSLLPSNPNYAGPQANDKIVRFSEKPGEIISLGLEANQHSRESLATLQSQLLAAIAGDTTEASLITDVDLLVSYTSAKYWADYNRYNDVIASLTGAIGIQSWVGSGIAKADPVLLQAAGGVVAIDYLPYGMAPSKFGVDLPNSNFDVVSIHNGYFHSEAWQLVGYNASALEHQIVEEVISSESISTMKGLKRSILESYGLNAAGQSTQDDEIRFFESRVVNGVRTVFHVYNLSSDYPDNIQQVGSTGGQAVNEAQFRALLVNHASATGTDLKLWNYLSGASLELTLDDGPATVMVPKYRTKLDNWRGAVYVAEVAGKEMRFIIQPDGGLPANGGYSGGNTTAPPPELRKGSFTNAAWAGDPVNTANGNMFRDETDFVFPNLGVPLTFSRHYDSQSKDDVGMGVGWTYSFSDYLYLDTKGAGSADDEIVWIKSTGERHRFKTSSSDGSFITPNELKGKLVKYNPTQNALGIGFRYFDATGMEYHFQEMDTVANGHPNNGFDGPHALIGRLRVQQDALGNGVQVDYVNPTIGGAKTQVRDLHTPDRRLVFGYGTADRVVSIARYDAGALVGTWSYTYIDITGVADSEKRLQSATTPFAPIVDAAGVESSTTSTTYYAYYNAAPGDPAYAKGMIKKITEGDGAWHTYEYYRNGRVFRVKQGEAGVAENSPSADIQTFDYNLFRSQTEFTDERGNVETYLHQRNGLLYKQVHADRSRLEYGWGSQNEWDEFLMQTSVDESGRTEAFYYHTSSSSADIHEHKQLARISVSGLLTPGFTTWFEYDDIPARPYLARLASTRTILGPDIGDRYTLYEYDSYGRVFREYDAEAHLTNGDPIISRRVNRTYYPDDDAVVYRRGLLKSVIQPSILDATGATVTHETVFDYDAAGNIFRVTTGGSVTSSYYDSFGNVGRTRGATDVVTDSLYDSLGRLRETGFGIVGTPVFNPIDAYTSYFKYDAIGRVRESKDANGRTLQMEYDRQGKVVREVRTDGSVLTHEYDPFGNRVKSTDAEGISTRFIYDNRNRLIQTVYSDGSVVTQRYDGAGRVIATSDALGNLTTHRFDGLGRLITTTQPDPDGPGGLTSPVSTNKYNKGNVLTETIDPEGNITQYKYDRLGRETQSLTLKGQDGDRAIYGNSPITGQLISLTTTDYDAVGNVSRTVVYDVTKLSQAALINDARALITPANITANNVQVTSYRYDAFGRLTKTINADSTETTTTYNASGQVRFQYDELQRVTEFQYDQYGRHVKTIEADPDGAETAYSSPITSFRYDNSGNLTATIDPRGFTTRYEYDAFNRRVAVIDAKGNRVQSLYDTNGQQVATVDALGRATYTLFDDRGRAIQQWQPDPDGAGPAAAPVTRHRYDAASRITETVNPEGYVTSFQRDRLGRVVKETFVSSYKVVDSTSAQFTIYSGSATTVAQPGDYGADAKLISPGSPNAVMIWNITGLDPGQYRVLAHWSGSASATTNLIYRLSDYYDESTGVAGSYWPEDVFATSAGSQRVPSGGQQRSEDGVWHQWKVLHAGFQIDAHGPTLGVHFASSLAIQADAIRVERLASRSYAYDANGNVLKETDERGNETIYSYDELERRATVTLPDPDGGSGLISPLSTTTYDGYGNVVAVTERRGNGTNIRKTSYEYDSRNLRTKEIIDADNGNVNVTYLNLTTTFDYDNVGNLVEKVELPGNALQRRTVYAFDSLNRLKQETRNSGAALTVDIDVTKHYYDPAGNVVVVQRNPGVDPRQIISVFRYDATGQLTESMEAGVLGVTSAQRTTRFQYDAAGNQVSEIDPLLRVSRSEFDRLDRVVTSIAPDPDLNGPKISDRTTFTYNDSGQVASQTNALNETERFSYDPQGRLIRSIDARGDITTREYDLAGNLAKVIDPAGNATSYSYDNLDRKLTETKTSGTRFFVYDINGNLQLTVDRNLVTTRYSYDRLDRTGRVWEYNTLNDALSGNQAFIAWYDNYRDDFGRLTEQRYSRRLTPAQGPLEYRSTESFKYDGLDRILEHSNQTLQGDGGNSTGPAWKQTFSYAYDSVGMVETRQEYINSQVETTTYTNIDQFGSTWKFSDHDAASGIGIDFGSRSSRFTYDASGAIATSLRLTNFSVLSPHQFNNHIETAYAYDGAGRISALTHKRTQHNGSPAVVSTAELLSFAYGYDDASRINVLDTNWNTAVGGLTTRVDSHQLLYYDLAGQLSTVSTPSGDEQSGIYGMSVNGRRAYSSDASGFLQNYYTADNRLSSDARRAFEYDAEGNQTRVDSNLDDSYAKYYWDHRNRLIKAEIFDATAALVETVNYRYNAANELIFRSVTPAGQSAQAEYYVNEDGRRSMTLEADGDVKRRYQYGTNGEVLFDQIFNAAGAPSVQPEVDVVEPLSDHQNSQRALVNGDDLTVRQSITYAPFGLVTAIYDSAGALEVTGSGSPDLTALDTAFGHHGSLVDIDTGLQQKGQRWYSPDQGRFISEDPIQEGSNWYMFAGNDPINFADPSGLSQEGHPLGGGYSGGKLSRPTQSTGSLSILGQLNAFYQGAKTLAPYAVSAANSAANAARSVIQTATDARMLNAWENNSSIMTPSGKSYFGGQGRYNFSPGTSFERRVASMHRDIQLQNEVGKNIYAGELSFEASLFHQKEIRQTLTEQKERGYQEWLQRQPTTWDKVKLWDNDVVARNVTNQIDQGAGFWKAIYVGVGTAIADNVGVSAIEDARSGRDFDGNRLSTGERVVRGALGTWQIAGTAAGLRVPVMRSASNIGSKVSALNARFNPPELMTGAIHKVGKYGYADLSNTGVALRSLSSDKIKITERGISVVEQHLSRFTNKAGRQFGSNTAMINDLRKISAGTLEPTKIHRDFYAHELREFVRYRAKGMVTGNNPTIYKNAHFATLVEYGIPFDTHPEHLLTPFAQSMLLR